MKTPDHTLSTLQYVLSIALTAPRAKRAFAAKNPSPSLYVTRQVLTEAQRILDTTERVEDPKAASVAPLEPGDELDADATPFERAHHYGSRRHPEAWIKANQAAIDLAINHGIDYTHPDMKTLLSQIALRVLDVGATGKTGRI